MDKKKSIMSDLNRILPKKTLTILPEDVRMLLVSHFLVFKSKFYERSGLPYTDYWLLHDKKDGIETEYYEKKYLYIKRKSTFRKGVKHGQETLYYPNGAIEEKIMYKNGMLHGYAKYWNNQGILIEEGNYYYNKKSDKWRTYFPSGYIMETIYSAGFSMES